MNGPNKDEIPILFVIVAQPKIATIRTASPLRLSFPSCFFNSVWMRRIANGRKELDQDERRNRLPGRSISSRRQLRVEFGGHDCADNGEADPTQGVVDHAAAVMVSTPTFVRVKLNSMRIRPKIGMAVIDTAVAMNRENAIAFVSGNCGCNPHSEHVAQSEKAAQFRKSKLARHFCHEL